MIPETPKTGRREFLIRTCAGASAAALGPDLATASPAGELPSIRLGTHRVTRLIAGGNPIGSHA
jgi:hypothetical protein